MALKQRKEFSVFCLAVCYNYFSVVKLNIQITGSAAQSSSEFLVFCSFAHV